MENLNTPKAQAGFTLIELVAVIVLLGILAVTALPRFVSLSTDAHSSVVAATGAAFKSGVDFVHLKWIARCRAKFYSFSRHKCWRRSERQR